MLYQINEYYVLVLLHDNVIDNKFVSVAIVQDDIEIRGYRYPTQNVNNLALSFE